MLKILMYFYNLMDKSKKCRKLMKIFTQLFIHIMIVTNTSWDPIISQHIYKAIKLSIKNARKLDIDKNWTMTHIYFNHLFSFKRTFFTCTSSVRLNLHGSPHSSSICNYHASFQCLVKTVFPFHVKLVEKTRNKW